MNKYKEEIVRICSYIEIDCFGNVYDMRNGARIEIKVHISDHGYYAINPHIFQGVIPIKVHRLVAYKKYGDAALADKIDTRHLNGIRTDNSWDNVVIGSRSDNMLDIPPAKRLEYLAPAHKAMMARYKNMTADMRVLDSKIRSDKAKKQWEEGKFGRIRK